MVLQKAFQNVQEYFEYTAGPSLAKFRIQAPLFIKFNKICPFNKILGNIVPLFMKNERPAQCIIFSHNLTLTFLLKANTTISFLRAICIKFS